MPRLVTGLFYQRGEAERAVEALKAQGIPAENIYLEREIVPSADMGRKGGQVGQLEQERRFAGLETGLIIGLAVGFLAGAGVGTMGADMNDMMHAVNPTASLPGILTSPWLAGIIGALLGLIAGGLIGWVVDFTLTQLGAGPPLPAQETLVTVRADEATSDQVYDVLFRARARHLHISHSAPV